MDDEVRRPADDGFTLVELLVVIPLLAVVGTIATVGMIDSMRVQREQVERSLQQNEVKVATERVTRDLRGANPVTVAQPNKVQVVATQGAVERTATFTLATVGADTRLIRTLVVRTLPSGPSVTTSQVVLDQLAMGAQPVFRYSDELGVAPAVRASPPAACDPAQPCYEPSEVAQIRLHLETAVSGTSRTIGLENVVNVRNEDI